MIKVKILLRSADIRIFKVPGERRDRVTVPIEFLVYFALHGAYTTYSWLLSVLNLFRLSRIRRMLRACGLVLSSYLGQGF
jgi:hypothetical protein